MIIYYITRFFFLTTLPNPQGSYINVFKEVAKLRGTEVRMLFSRSGGREFKTPRATMLVYLKVLGKLYSIEVFKVKVTSIKSTHCRRLSDVLLA